MDNKELRRNFIKTAYQTLDSVVAPTPYLEITEGDNVNVTFLNGEGRLPTPKSTEITVLDIDLASLFFDDFHVLKEGVTGTGKSYTADALGHMICSSDGYLNLTLSGGAIGTSAVQPFTTFDPKKMELHVDPKKCAKYGILFLDEINAGDFKDTSRVVEGVAQVNGEREYLRLPIPDTDRYKKISIIAAMNPSDALHSHARELSIAGENRFLKFKFPNGVSENASGQPDKDISDDLHEQFWRSFQEKTGDKRGWRDIYPLVTDEQQFRAELDGATQEFIDIALSYVGNDPLEAFERNAGLLQQAGIRPLFSVRKDNDYKKILDAQSALKHGFVRRDVRKIRNLSRLLGFIKSIKDGSYNPTVSLNDVAASIGIVLESKAVNGTVDGKLMTLVNDALATYRKMTEEIGIPAGYGLRQAVWQAAVNAGQRNGFKTYIDTLRQGAVQINTQQTGNASQVVARSRMLADLVVLEHFSKTYEQDVTAALKEKGNAAFGAFAQVYEANKNKGSVYQRLDSIIR
ncbi:MAG: hypothetical protein KKA62_03965 [Nanoarchaeota archaeon]|nr:hypothetical protein [Nanoarchaeota archaeon]MBU1643984.1 hypothetical protein [Nanoarchaeota archaeon]MBU1977079.1 hypothetical protein [Nanoarchaeota archaeon]